MLRDRKRRSTATLAIYIMVIIIEFTTVGCAGLAKDRVCLSYHISLINASKTENTLSHFPRRYCETLPNVYGKVFGLHEQAHLCHISLPMRLCHMLKFTLAFFPVTSQIWQRKIASLNAPLAYVLYALG